METDIHITPGFGLISSEEQALELARRLGYPLILKPTNLVKSLLVLRCDDQSQLIRNFKSAKEKIGQLYEKHRVYDHQPLLIAEQYVKGGTCSIAAFVDSRGQPQFCDGIVSLTNAQDIGIDDNYVYRRQLPAQFDKDLRARLFEAARKGISALDMSSTPAHVELIHNDHETKLIEIGARIGGYRPRMYAMSYDIDLIAQEFKLALGQMPQLEGNLKENCAVYEIFPDQEGLFGGIEEPGGISEFSYYSIKAKAGSTVGPAKNGYKAAAIVIVANPDNRKFKEICKKAEQLKVKIK